MVPSPWVLPKPSHAASRADTPPRGGGREPRLGGGCGLFSLPKSDREEAVFVGSWEKQKSSRAALGRRTSWFLGGELSWGRKWVLLVFKVLHGCFLLLFLLPETLIDLF